MTGQIKTLIRLRQHAFETKNMSLWRHYRNKAIKSICKAKICYYNTRVGNLKTSDPAAWYKRIKIMTGGQQRDTPIVVPDLEPNGSQPSKQIANCINQHFCSIASDLPRLDRKNLPSFLPA